MIFPLLLAVSRRLAALIPTALMTLMAIAAMLVFAKKAFLMSAAALAVALYDSYRSRRKQQHHATYAEVVEPMDFTEVHFKPYSPPTHHSDASSPSYHYKRPSSYNVPLHGHGHSRSPGAASYYRQRPYGGGGGAYSKPYSAYSSPSQALDAGPDHAGGPGSDSSYEVVDDYRPLGGGPAFVADASEQKETFAPFYPNHNHNNHQSQPPPPPQQESSLEQDRPAPAASMPAPARLGPGPNHRPFALQQH